MVTIYCSNKLSSFLGIKNKAELNASRDKLFEWNAMLFYANKRKCLMFTNKKTLYSFFALDILKRYLTDPGKLFITQFFDQLKRDNLLTENTINFFTKNYYPAELFSTDNDRKTIGCMNENLHYAEIIINENSSPLPALETYLGSYVNQLLMTKNYIKPFEMMSKQLSELIR